MSRDVGGKRQGASGGPGSRASTEPHSSEGLGPTGFDPSRETFIIEGVAYVLPRYEGRPRWVRRVGSYGLGVSWRWTSFNLGVDILQAGFLLAIGPAYFWIAHIERQLAAFDGLNRDSDGSPKGGDACGSVHESAGPKDIARTITSSEGTP